MSQFDGGLSVDKPHELMSANSFDIINELISEAPGGSPLDGLRFSSSANLYRRSARSSSTKVPNRGSSAIGKMVILLNLFRWPRKRKTSTKRHFDQRTSNS